jgi:hypothetical protein
MSASFTVRIATRDDATSIAEFNVIFAKASENRQLSLPVTAAGVRHVFDSFNNGLYVVAEQEGKVIGVTMVTREWSDWNNGTFYCIQDIFVLAQDPQKIIHDALLEKVRTLAKEHENVCGIRLYAHKDDTQSQEHYEKLNLKKTPYRIYDEVF